MAANQLDLLTRRVESVLAASDRWEHTFLAVPASVQWERELLASGIADTVGAIDLEAPIRVPSLAVATGITSMPEGDSLQVLMLLFEIETGRIHSELRRASGDGRALSASLTSMVADLTVRPPVATPSQNRGPRPEAVREVGSGLLDLASGDLVAAATHFAAGLEFDSSYAPVVRAEIVTRPLLGAPPPTVGVVAFSGLWESPDSTVSESSATALGRSVSAILSTRLVRRGGLRVLEREHLQSLIGEVDLPDEASRAGWLASARYLVEGSVAVYGDSVELEAQVHDAGARSLVAQVSRQGHIDNLFELGEGMGDAVGREIMRLQAVPPDAYPPLAELLGDLGLEGQAADYLDLVPERRP